MPQTQQDKDVQDYKLEVTKIEQETLQKAKELASEAELSDSERYKKTAELMAYDLRAKEALAERYAEKSLLAGSVDSANAFKATAKAVGDIAAGVESKITSNMDAAQFKSIFGEIGSKMPLGEAITIYQLGKAVGDENWNEVGKQSTSLLYATLGGVVAVGIVATLPISGTALAITSVIAGIAGAIYGDDVGGRIWDTVSQYFTSANSFVLRADPLVLDLDGDGIETVDSTAGITFDFDGDGLKTGTGWAAKDDGFLALDRNGDGKIDNGAELFGVDFLKSNGQKATNGFDALKDLDSNGDGVFDANDTQFANVRVWQDLNQDGVSQVNELKSLADHHITSINLTATASNQNSNGNIISAIGSFVRDDGSIGAVNGNQSIAGNLDLASNPFYREFTDHLPLDEAAKALPDMKGSGAVRDLREASMQNSALKGVLAEYAGAQTREQQMALLDSLLSEWAGSSNYRTFEQRVSDLSTGVMTVDFEWSWEQDLGFSGGGSGASSGSIDPGSISSGPTTAQLQQKTLLERVRLLEVFNAQNFFNFTKEENGSGGLSRLGVKSGASLTNISGSAISNNGGTQSGGASIASHWTLTEKNLVLNEGQANFINQAYESLRESIYNGLLLQTRLRPYVEAIGVTLDENGLGLDFSKVATLFQTTFDNNHVNGATDLLEFVTQQMAGRAITELNPLVERFVTSLSSDEITKINALGIGLQLGAAGNQSLSGKDKQDYLFGLDGNDALYGGAGNDFLAGGTGNDTLRGEAGNDTLIGGAGNDYLSGDAGSDVYRFERGWGQDTVYNYDTNTSTSKVDAIEFAANIAASDIVVTRFGDDLILRLKGSTDQITVQSYFNGDAAGSYRLEEVRFADGTAWNIAQVKA
ncbi:hypothetical protein NK553_09600, partial [Pseudomonas sp. ZM23]|nr:hypothetical protein [Pseudomonas triclosanedens]MCP8471335.1 hypothetical protein [Pseudomonas triclosanedens]MCP8477856.1 hypothetical protein [Pseudomonas triclosanedens]